MSVQFVQKPSSALTQEFTR